MGYNEENVHMGSLDYHLKELGIALDRNDERRILPTVLDSDKVILDIGCGIGQTFIALDWADRTCVGLDVDKEAIRFGSKNYGSKIQFILSDAQYIPLPASTFDLVYGRVSLPYTNIPKVIREIRRVLRSDGRVWMTLHSRDRAVLYLKEAIRSRNIKRLMHVTYILINGYLLKYFGIVLRFLDGSYESWQDLSAMKKLLVRSGFKAEVHEAGRHTVIEGRPVRGRREKG